LFGCFIQSELYGLLERQTTTFLPKANRIGYLEDVSAPISKIFVREVQRAAQQLGVSITVDPVPRPDDVVPQLDAMVRDRVEAFIVDPTAVPRTRQKEIIVFAAAQRLTAMYAGRDYVDTGGLMSYNASRPDIGRQGALYVVKILNGARPGEHAASAAGGYVVRGSATNPKPTSTVSVNRLP